MSKEQAVELLGRSKKAIKENEILKHLLVNLTKIPNKSLKPLIEIHAGDAGGSGRFESHLLWQPGSSLSSSADLQ